MTDTDLAPLPHRFAVPVVISVESGANGLPFFKLSTRDGEAHVHLHGAHVTHFQPRGADRPVLWMSGKSWFEPVRPIRGGVPLIFPWFGPHATEKEFPAHG